MSQAPLLDQTKPMTGQEAVAEFERIRSEIAERTKDLTDDELQELADEWAREVKDRLNAGFGPALRNSD